LGVRIYELAKELNVRSKLLLQHCQENGIPVSNHMNSLDDEQERKMREYLAGLELKPKTNTQRKASSKARTAPAVRLARPPSVRPVTAPPIHPRGKGRLPLPPRPVVGRPVLPPAPPPKKAKPRKQEVAATQGADEAPPAAPQPAPPTQPAGAATSAAEPERPRFGVVRPAPPPPPPVAPDQGKTPAAAPPIRTAPGAGAARIKRSERTRFGVVKPAPPRTPTPPPKTRTARPAARSSAGKAPAGRPPAKEAPSRVAALAGRMDRKGGAGLGDRTVRIRRPRRTQQGAPTAERDGSTRFRVRRGRRELKPKMKTRPEITKPVGKVVLDYPVSVRDFSAGLGIKLDRIIKVLMEQFNLLATINQILPEEMVELLAAELGVEVEVRKQLSLEEELIAGLAAAPEQGEAQPRAPVVTFLGHVDHGKTSLLDAIRKTDVAAHESGGITQHVSAFRIDRGNQHVVFLDTPGHEAFTAMRARGANVTDVAVLIIAADDGVMPQTDEAINHARAADVPIVVAANKIDKPEADIDRVKRQLAERDLLPEDWGGPTVCVPVSAVTHEGLDNLVEMLSLEAELLELTAHPAAPARGVVLEARVAGGLGIVADVLVLDGTLRKGDIVVCGAGWGRVRALTGDKGQQLDQAGPATPVVVSGLSHLPEAGEKLYALSDAQKARTMAEQRRRRDRATALAERQHVTLETLYQHIEAGKTKELRIILKADVQGTLEALRKSIEQLSTGEVRLRILHAAAGGVNESDVLLADASDAIIIGFHVVADDRARVLAEQRHVEIRLYQVIYQATDEIRAAIEGMLEPEHRERVVSHLNVLKTFRVSRVGTIAGCVVADGTIHRTDKVRVVRDNIVTFDGTIESLRRVKDDIREATAGTECGLKVANFNDVKEGDVLVAYQVEDIARRLSTVLAEEKEKEQQRRRQQDEEEQQPEAAEPQEPEPDE